MAALESMETVSRSEENRPCHSNCLLLLVGAVYLCSLNGDGEAPILGEMAEIEIELEFYA